MKAFVMPYFSYCPLTCMFHRWTLKLALKLGHNDTTNLSFDELLVKD